MNYSLFQSRAPVSKNYKVPGLLPSLLRKFSKITSRVPKLQQSPRVDLTTEGLECLELIFGSIIQNDALVNLKSFLNEVTIKKNAMHITEDNSIYKS